MGWPGAVQPTTCKCNQRRLAPNPGSTAPCSAGQNSRDKSWRKRKNCFILEASNLGRWWTNVLRLSSSCQLGDKAFKDSESEGAAGCLISFCTVRILIGIKVKFQTSPVFQFQSSQGSPCLWSAVFIWWGPDFSKNRSESNLDIFHGTGSSVTLLVYGLNCYRFPGPKAILCFYIITFPNH